MKMFNALHHKVTNFLSSIFGKVSWTSPPWYIKLSQGMRNFKQQQPKLLAVISCVVILLIIIGSWFAYQQWFATKPMLLSARINLPEIQALTDKASPPSPIVIKFGYQRSIDYLQTQSVAPLAQINKKIITGIHIQPEIAGEWFWLNDHEIRFTPTQAWQADTHYTVQFAKSVFAENTKFDTYSYSFTTQALSASIENIKFYQDPRNPEIKQIVATVDFNYPIDVTSLSKNLKIMPQELSNGKINLQAKSYAFTIKAAKLNRRIYIHSENISLPENPQYMQLIINKDVKVEQGSAFLNKPIMAKVLIPDAGSILKIENIHAGIVRDEHGNPQQVLNLLSSLGVQEKVAADSIHVYLLPKYNPQQKKPELKVNYAWRNPGQINATILQQATAITLQIIPASHDFSKINSFRFNAPGGRYLYVTVDKGLKGFGDYYLKEDFHAILRVPNYPREISFLHKGALLALSGEHKLSMGVRGIPAVNFEIARVLPIEINHLMSQTVGDFAAPVFINAYFNESNISVIHKEIRKFNSKDPASTQYTSLDFDQYLKSKDNTQPLGLFFLKARPWNIKKNEATGPDVRKFILITDMGIMVKNNADKSHDIFVSSITQNTPVAKADVKVLGKNGLPLLHQQTDEQGHTLIKSLEDFTDDQEPVVYVVTQGNDISFLPYKTRDRALNYSRFDVGGIKNDDTSSLSAFIFSDRGIYRPGEKVHLGLIIKQAYATAAANDLPLQLVIYDPNGNKVLDQQLTNNKDGYNTFDYKVNRKSPTGDFHVNIFIVKDKHHQNYLGETSFRVEEFLPDTMKITSEFYPTVAKGWVSPHDLIAKVRLTNLFGTPAAEQRITGKIVLTPQQFYFKDYTKYTFNDPLYNSDKPPHVQTDDLPDQKTNDKGEAQFALPLTQYDKATYKLMFYAQGFAKDSGRSVSTQNSILVSPLDYLIGYIKDDKFNFIKQNSSAAVNLIAINNELQQIIVDDLQAELFQVNHVATLVENADGTYQYQTIDKEELLNKSALTITKQGISYPLATDKIGQFVLTIKRKDGTTLTRIPYAVVGESQIRAPKSNELSVILDKSEYTPDSDIQLQITAPYSGTGLVTIERDKVYAFKWFTSTTTNTVQTIHIPRDFIGNGYVNVSFVRDWNSPEIFLSPLSYNVIPFNVNRESHNIKITLNAAEQARAGKDYPIQYATDRPAKIIVYAVNEGILQVADYQMPNPLSFFFQKRALQVVTLQIIDLILPKFIAARELSAVAGGDSAALYKNGMIGQYLNPFKRQTEPALAYWSGIVDADSTLRTITYKMPDSFNGTVRIMAVAASDNAVGSASQKALIQNDFIINPNLPTAVAPGDTFIAAVNVTNNTKQADIKQVLVSINTDKALEVSGEKQLNLTIEPGQEKTAIFKVKARSVLGNAGITFKAEDIQHTKSSISRENLSVRPAMPRQIILQSGYEKSAKKSILLTNDFYPELHQGSIAVSTSPLILITGLQRFLQLYPYGCTEQLVSKGFANLIMRNTLNQSQTDNKVEQKVNTTIQMIQQRQTSKGSFAYWPGAQFGVDSYAEQFASVYAMHFLTMAKEANFIVSEDMFAQGLNYLKELATYRTKNLAMARVQAYAIYILTRNEIVTTNYLTNLQLYLENNYHDTWRKDIASSYLAATYEMLKDTKQAQQLIAGYKLNQRSTTEVDDFFHYSTFDAEYIYLLANHFPDKLQDMEGKPAFVIVSHLAQDPINTTLAAFDILALDAFESSFSKTTNNLLSVQEELANQQKNTLVMSPDKATIFSNEAKQLQIENASKEGYFYQLSENGFSRQLPTKQIAKGLEIFKEYQDNKQVITKSIPVGTDITVHVKIRATDNNYYQHIMIVDLLPGGFEVIPNSFVGDYAFADAREDRILLSTSVGSEVKEFTYHIKPIAQGTYMVPPIFAENMYNQNVMGMSAASNISVQ